MDQGNPGGVLEPHVTQFVSGSEYNNWSEGLKSAVSSLGISEYKARKYPAWAKQRLKAALYRGRKKKAYKPIKGSYKLLGRDMFSLQLDQQLIQLLITEHLF